MPRLLLEGLFSGEKGSEFPAQIWIFSLYLRAKESGRIGEWHSKGGLMPVIITGPQGRIFFIAQLATGLHSSGNAEFR